MKTIKNSMTYGAALLMAVSVGSVYAADADMAQDRVRDELKLHTPETADAVPTQAQDRVRDQLKLHAPEADHAQDRLREHSSEHNMEQMRNQNRNEYRHKQNTQTRPTPMHRSSRGAR